WPDAPSADGCRRAGGSDDAHEVSRRRPRSGSSESLADPLRVLRRAVRARGAAGEDVVDPAPRDRGSIEERQGQLIVLEPAARGLEPLHHEPVLRRNSDRAGDGKSSESLGPFRETWLVGSREEQEGGTLGPRLPGCEAAAKDLPHRSVALLIERCSGAVPVVTVVGDDTRHLVDVVRPVLMVEDREQDHESAAVGWPCIADSSLVADREHVVDRLVAVVSGSASLVDRVTMQIGGG